MNPTEQQQRHTAVTQLASDVETVVGALARDVKRLAETQVAVARDQARLDGRITTLRTRVDADKLDLLETTAPLRRAFLGRLRWLVRGG